MPISILTTHRPPPGHLHLTLPTLPLNSPYAPLSAPFPLKPTRRSNATELILRWIITHDPKLRDTLTPALRRGYYTPHEAALAYRSYLRHHHIQGDTVGQTIDALAQHALTHPVALSGHDAFTSTLAYALTRLQARLQQAT